MLYVDICLAIRQSQKRLASIIAAKGGHVEHFVDQLYDYCRHVTLVLRMYVMFTI